MASIFMRIHVANPRPLDRLLRFIVLCFLRGEIINNVAFRPQRVVYAAVFVLDVATALRLDGETVDAELPSCDQKF